MSEYTTTLRYHSIEFCTKNVIKIRKDISKNETREVSCGMMIIEHSISVRLTSSFRTTCEIALNDSDLPAKSPKERIDQAN